MPIVGFRFRAYTNEQTLRALKAQLEAACEAYNTLRWADTYFYHEDGKGLTLTELRQLALDLRKQDEEYQQLYSQVLQQIADRYYEANLNWAFNALNVCRSAYALNLNPTMGIRKIGTSLI